MSDTPIRETTGRPIGHRVRPAWCPFLRRLYRWIVRGGKIGANA